MNGTANGERTVAGKLEPSKAVATIFSGNSPDFDSLKHLHFSGIVSAIFAISIPRKKRPLSTCADQVT